MTKHDNTDKDLPAAEKAAEKTEAPAGVPAERAPAAERKAEKEQSHTAAQSAAAVSSPNSETVRGKQPRAAEPKAEEPSAEDALETEAGGEGFLAEAEAEAGIAAAGAALSDAEEEEDEEDDAEGEETASVEPGEEDLEYVQDDPLAPAYDLERGNLIDTKQSTSLPWRSDVRTAKEFFNSELLYRFDVLEEQPREQIQGKYRIELKGYQGGVWTINVGEELEVVNRREDADLVMIMQQRDFLQMVNGRLNPQLAILGNKMKILGDVKRAIWFQTLLYPIAD